MEFVYVVPRRDLFDLAFPHGFVADPAPEGHPSLEEYLDRIARHGYFVERAWAEQRSDVKQIIPYTLVTHADHVFLVRRLPQSGEQRLHGKRSVGIGGHINPEDDPGDRRELLANATRRELAEELHIDSPYRLRALGVINDDDNPVGSVHFGLVQMATLEAPEVRVRETDVLEGSLVPLAEAAGLRADPDANLETWSALILEHADTLSSSSS